MVPLYSSPLAIPLPFFFIMPDTLLAPSISLIKLAVQHSGEKLDKLKSNYKEWSEKITIMLSMNGLYEYVNSMIPAPATSETCMLANWKTNSCLAYTFLASSIISSECLFINMDKDMAENWEALCK